MASDNSITLVGNLTRDPEMRFTPSGAANCRLGIAVNRRWRGQDGEWQEQVSFFNIVCWREMAENVSASLRKGNRVVVAGRLEQRSWETEQGEKRSVVEVVADEIGPSLRWASADVTRNERRGPGEFGGQPAAGATSSGSPASASGGQASGSEGQASGSGGQASGTGAPGSGYDDFGEEPF